MTLSLKLILTALIATSCYLYADEVVARAIRYDGGLVISWQHNSSDASSDQIEISDAQGHRVTALNILRPVPDAGRVGIYDVSARGNLIAVAAVYVNKQGSRKVRNTASLLFFNLHGQLLSALALGPSHAVARLAVDDKSNVWTLTDGAGPGVSPATVPVVVEYTHNGDIAKELLTRNMFPFHASDTREDVRIGSPVMGYDAGVVWFWLPGSMDLVTISASDHKVNMTKPGLPTTGRDLVPLTIRREPSGKLVAQVAEDDGQGSRVMRHYLWSVASGWARFTPSACDGLRLIGTSQEGQVYVPFQAAHASTCVFRDPH